MKLNITETMLRDAQQSLIATRMTFEQFKESLELLDKAGYYSLECWGGATSIIPTTWSVPLYARAWRTALI